MDNPAAPAEGLNVEQLLQLHTLTKEVARACQKQLRGYLDTMALLFRPRRILGEAMEGAEPEAGGDSERTLAELRDLYRKVALRPFDLRPELSVPLEAVSTKMQLYDWEYLHQSKTDRGWRSINVTSPLTWVVAYSSTYSLSMVRQVLSGQEKRDSDAVRAFVLRACLIHLHFQRFPALAELLAGLRYKVEVRYAPETGDLPFVTISAPFSTIRPPDSLVAVAAGLAGGTSFAEVLDLATVQNLKDPLREQVAAILRSHGQEL
ncbi:MAG TPA: hypothetical protein VMJ75_00735 [Candidatus Acidoferrales bacterium]|nr:hypothetical protein [Candidatus Acidoferrales bacterium]